MANPKKITAIGHLQELVNTKKDKLQVEETVKDMTALQLSLFDIAPWSDNMRGMPNDIARCALFTTRHPKVERVAYTQQPVYSFNKDVKMLFTGTELRAIDDELVWIQVLEYVKRLPYGDEVSFSLYQLCKDLGLTPCKGSYTKIENSLSRLFAAAIQITSERLGRLQSVKLISKFYMTDRSTRSAKCHVQIEQDLIVLFANKHYSRFEWESYRSLTPTARRLYDYFISHKEPYPLSLKTFQQICGSETAQLRKWRQQCEKACQELVEKEMVTLAFLDKDDDSLKCIR